MSGAFDGTSVLVTGGTRGIGRAIVEAFVREGATVTFTGRRSHGMSSTGREDPCGFGPPPCTARSTTSWKPT